MAARTSGFRPSNTTSRGVYSAGKETTNEMVYDLRDSDPSTVATTETNFRRGWHRYGEAFFRSIGLQFINTFLPWGQDAEFPKIAIEKNKWTVLIRSLLHIPPLIGCFVLLVLTFMTTILQPNSAFSILQFAAKLHEILMQASIAAILLSHVRYEITTNGQVPFGSLFAPAQISSIGYIWSPEMAGTIKSKGMGWFKKSALVVHILFAITLAAAVGPSSAILMIPRPIHPMLGQCTVRLPTDVDALYPSRLTLETPRKADFAAVSRLYENIYSQNDVLVDTIHTTQSSLGATIFDYISSRILNLFEHTASAPSQLIADAIMGCAIASWSKYEIHMSLESKQPFVYVDMCFETPIINMTSSSQLIATQPFATIYDDAELNITLGEFNDSYKESNSSHILWATPPKNYSMTASIIAVVAPDLNDVSTGAPWYWTCPLVASWLPAIVNTSDFYRIQAFPIKDTASLINEVFNSTNIISIDPAWAYNATANANPLNSSIGSPTLSDLLDLSYIPGFEYNEPLTGMQSATSPRINELVIGGIISTAMSTALTVNAINVTYVNTTFKRTDASVAQGIWMPNITSDPQITRNESTFPPGAVSGEETQLLAEHDPSRSFNIDVYGKSLIGYAFESIPVFLATTVICLYCMYVLISIFISIIVGISSSSWDSVSEITALALNSTPPSHLGSISAGLNTLRVFQEPVGIFTNEKDGLELVFREGNGGLDNYKAIERNKEY